MAMRMCLGCGERAPQSQMHRIVSTATGALTPVVRSPRSGRSGYLHRDQACLQRFASRKGAVRSLGRTIDKETRIALVGALEALGHTCGMR